MTYEVYLAHHGVKGQKWGVRRYQNEDGSYTEVGKKKYAKAVRKADKKEIAYYNAQRKDVEARDVLEKAQNRGLEARNRRARETSARIVTREYNREQKARKTATRSLKKTEKYFNKQVKKLTKRGYEDPELDRFVKMAEHLTSQRQLLSAGRKEYFPGAKAKASSNAMKQFLSTQASDAAKYQTSKTQEWAEYLWRKSPWRKDYY